MLVFYFEVFNNRTGEVKHSDWFYNYDAFMLELKSWLEILGPGGTVLTKLEYLE